MVLFNNIEEALEGVKNEIITWERFIELKNEYDRWYEESSEYGFVGVGKISFANAMLQDFQGGNVDPIRVPQMYTDEDLT